MKTRMINWILQKLACICPGGYRMRPGIQRLRGAHIGGNVWISQFVYIDELHPEAIYIGDHSTIGLRTSIFTHFYWGPRKTSGGYKEVKIGKKVFIGPHCLILPGVKIGDGAVIKGGSVVSRNVPAWTFWGPPECGPLGRVTVPLSPEFSYEEFMKGLKPFRRGSQDA